MHKGPASVSVSSVSVAGLLHELVPPTTGILGSINLNLSIYPQWNLQRCWCTKGSQHLYQWRMSMKLHQLVNHSKHGDRNQSLAWHQSLDTSHQIPGISHQSSGKYVILVIQVISFPSGITMEKPLRGSVTEWMAGFIPHGAKVTVQPLLLSSWDGRNSLWNV